MAQSATDTASSVASTDKEPDKTVASALGEIARLTAPPLHSRTDLARRRAQDGKWTPASLSLLLRC